MYTAEGKADFLKDSDHEHFDQEEQEERSSWGWMPDSSLLLNAFDRLTKRQMQFHLLFFSLFGICAGITLFFFFRLWEAWLLAAGLGSIILLLFLYFTLRLYLRLQRPILYKQLQERYVTLCKEAIDSQGHTPEQLLELAQHLLQAASELEGREYHYYRLPTYCAKLWPYQEKWSKWWHSQDLLTMRELLLLAAIEVQLDWVRQEPTRIEAHTALANRYVALSRLYATALENEALFSADRLRDEYTEKFRVAAEHAMQEFHILNRYAPNDPWIHMQLAYSYRDLQMPNEEMKEHEIVLTLRPDDCNTLLRLATLCFEQGQTARGLEFYEQLRRLGEPRAEALLDLYGASATRFFY